MIVCLVYLGEDKYLPCVAVNGTSMPLLSALGEEHVSPEKANRDGRDLKFKTMKPLLETPVTEKDALKILAKHVEPFLRRRPR